MTIIKVIFYQTGVVNPGGLNVAIRKGEPQTPLPILDAFCFQKMFELVVLCVRYLTKSISVLIS